jgi:ribosome maturation factor RimP
MKRLVTMAVSFEELNRQTVILVQAMLGAISSNFRMVSIRNENGVWILRFYLEREDTDDIEEMDDIEFEFSALQDDDLEVRKEVIITDKDIDWPEHPTVVVYKRRETP